MKIKLSKGHMASQNDILALQKKIGEPLVREFLEFVAENDGAAPENNIFKIGIENGSGINEFIPVEQIVREMAKIENLPRGSFPIAWVEGGNYVFIDQSCGGAVFFWDHEQPNEIMKIAGGFRAFLDILEPSDINSLRLKTGQVKKAWIDPDFFKKIQG